MASSEREKETLADYLTVSEAASTLGVSKSTLRNWDRAGKLKAHRHPINKYRLYKRTDLQRLLEEVQQTPRRKVSHGN